MKAREDKRWQDAQAAYVDEYDGVDADQAFRLRCAAATRMYEIEREYKPSLPPVIDVLARIPDYSSA